MSVPISFCLIVKAASDEEAYQLLKGAMTTNLQCGHWSQIPCACDPRCEAPLEELEALQRRLNEDIKGVEPDDKHSPSGPAGPAGEGC